jgi:signal transduction histidine kinase
LETDNQVLSALSAPVVSSGEEELGTVVVLRDITREVEAEKLKDDFITSMSHELRTPPTAIKGYVDLLKMTAASQLDDRQLGFIDAIDQNVKDLLNIIQQMLDLSQIDAGTLGIDQELQNITELIEMEADNWVEQMTQRQLEFNVHLPDDPIWVTGDWSRLTKVMSHLLSNAHNYTLPGGQVDISVVRKNILVQVDIKDTGVGISEEDQRFLFTRFFRAIHEESTFDVSGAGLGLYISKAIVEAHGGNMWMESELNKGSIFSFALPVVDPESVESEETYPVVEVHTENL